MKRLSIAIMTILVGGTALTATAADAQAWHYHEHRADRAFDSAGIRQFEARKDQHAADVAAYYGDYGAADYYAHAAHVRRVQSWRDAHYGRREERVAHRDYWYGY